jgi:peroxiredoxin
MDRLPVPEDDGAASHLPGAKVPRLVLSDASGAPCELGELGRPIVLYVYPATGVPGRDPALDPAPGWDEIPGAPGCTAQSHGYRELYLSFRGLGFEVMGVSTQPASEQQDFMSRNAVPFRLLSDPELVLSAALALPTFSAGNRRFYKRLSLAIVDGTVVHVRYPVFPPHRDAEAMLAWLERQSHLTRGRSR